MTDLRCPSCGSIELKYFGDIHNIHVFAGKETDLDIKRGLWKCNSCSLYFSYPRLDVDKLNELYSKGDPENWRYTIEIRKDWQIAVDFIKKYVKQGSRILDIGSWDGSFLSYLSEYDVYGIEINEEAVYRAKHVKLIANDLYKLDVLLYKDYFDVITAFDVIEHVINPLEFISILKTLVKSGGYIIISSGNTESLPWKILKNRYYYCSILEHITFINKDWCEFAASELNLNIIKICKFSHSKRSYKNFLYETAINLIYLLSPYFVATLRKLKNKQQKKISYYLYPPSWSQLKDHLLVIFRK